MRCAAGWVASGLLGFLLGLIFTIPMLTVGLAFFTAGWLIRDIRRGN